MRSVYVPTTHNVLLFDENKQIQANAYVGTNTTQLQLAYNPLKHFAFSVNTASGSGLSIYEGSVGFFEYSKKNAVWRYEVLTGGGVTNNFSQVNNAWVSVFKKTKSNYETISKYSKFYIQPSIGFFGKIAMYKLNYSLSFTGKVSYINFNTFVYREINKDATANSSNTVYFVNREYKDCEMFLFEPCFTNKVGMRNVYAVIQAQVMMPYSEEIDIRYTKFSPVFLLSFGIQYNFVFKNKKATKT